MNGPYNPERDRRAAERALQWRPGQVVQLDPYYNQTATSGRRIQVPTRVRGVRRHTSQTGVQVAVKDERGRQVWLDAAWFLLADEVAHG